MKALSLRLRLTLLYFVFFAAAGLLLSATSWLLLKQSLGALLQHELDERIDDLESLLNAQSPTATVAELRDILRQEYASKDEGKWLQVVDGSGRWLYFSSRPKIGSATSPPPEKSGKLLEFRAEQGHSLADRSRTLAVGARTYTVSMAISSDRSVKILSQFCRSLLFTVPAVLIGAAMLGYLLSRNALAPIQALANEVQQIHEQNLSRRLPISNARDELSQLSETLNQMLERIDFAFRGVKSLTANASHELRTPLSLIRTRVEIALCFPRSADEYRTVLEEVRDESVRMSALLEKLLLLARQDAENAQPLLCELVELTGLLRKAALEWSPAAEQAGLTLSLQEPTGQVHVSGDRDALDRLIRMLVENACRYTLPGGTIKLRVEESNGDATLQVEDSGIGIVAEDRPRIFERFYRGRHSQSLQPGGSGLGLSLAKWIADQHNASISVESTPGQGSTFSVRFMKTGLSASISRT